MVSKQSTLPVSKTQTSSATENLSAENETSVKLENVPNATATAPNVADTVGKSVQVGTGNVAENTDVGTKNPSEALKNQNESDTIESTEVGAGELSYNDFTLDKTKNTKTGDDIWVIRPKEKVDNFTELKAKMKAIGGYYSPYPTTPHGKGGFVFKTDPSHLFGNAQNTSNSIETTTNQTKKQTRRKRTMAEEKKFPTPAMLKAREEWEKKSPEEKKVILNAFEEKLMKYYTSTMSTEHNLGTMGTEADE